MELSDRTTEYAGATGTHCVGGTLYPEYVTERSLHAVKNYEVRDDDIWICGFPKAGSHWVGEIVKQVLVDGHTERVDRTKQSHAMSFEKYLDKEPLYEQAMKWPSPRCLNTHLQEHLLPNELREGKGKMIYVVRNPKDCAVSMYFFLKPRNYCELSVWDQFIQLFGTEQMRWGSWYTHTLSFWNKRHDYKNLLILKYEDMKQDIKATVLKIAEFLGHPLDAEVIEQIVQNASMDEMKKVYYVVGESNYGEMKTENKVGMPHMLRKGVVGDWKNQFTVAQSEAFDKIYDEKMAGSGLTLQFE